MRKRLKKKKFFRNLNKFIELNNGGKSDLSDYILAALLEGEIIRLGNLFKKYKFINNNKEKIVNILNKYSERDTYF